MTQETSQSILTWGDETFGPVRDAQALIARARLELDELSAAVSAKDVHEIGREAADVAILLHRLVGHFGQDLAQEIDLKMQTNRARRWAPAGDGTGAHLK